MFTWSNINDVALAAEAAATLFTGLITATKFLTYLFKKEKFLRLMDRVQELGFKNVNEPEFKKADKLRKYITRCYLISAIMSGTTYATAPILSSAGEFFFKGKEFLPGMPVKAEFLYEPSGFFLFSMSYFGLCFAICNNVCVNAGVDSLFVNVSMNLCGHLKTLRNSFDGDKQKFVETHRELTELLEDLDKIMKPIVFFQFFISSMQLCLIGFSLIMHDNAGQWIVDTSYASAITIQMFLYAFSGQEIIESSSAVADEFYETDQDLVIIIARAKKASKISSAFYTATLPAFTAILSSTASFITILQSFL